MEMRLKKLSLENFKGALAVNFMPRGMDCKLRGPNASGKTTLFDAWMWLMTGKDSLGQTPGTFELKTIADGETKHAVDHAVEAVLSIQDGADQEIVNLRKVYREKYTKKRGAQVAGLTGHTTEYMVDGVPKTETEFRSYLHTIIPADWLELLSDIRGFAEKMDWQTRRRILMSVCGDISDAEIIAATGELRGLPEVLGKRSVDDWRAVAKSQMAKLNSQLKEIPARIDEATRSQVAVDPPDAHAGLLKKQIHELNQKLKSIDAEILRVTEGGEIAQKTKRITELQAQFQEVANAEQEAIRAAKAALIEELDQEQEATRLMLRTRAGLEDDRQGVVLLIDETNHQLAQLREGYAEIIARKFAPQARPDTCPTCGQDIPTALMDSLLQQARDSFMGRRAEDMRSNVALGKAAKEKLDTWRRQQADMDQQLAALEQELTNRNAQIEELQQKIQNVVLPDDHPLRTRRAEIILGIQTLEAAVSELRISSHDAISDLDGDRQDLQDQLTAAQQLVAMIEQNQRAAARIRELEKLQSNTAQEYERLEAGMFLTDRFITTKVEMLTQRINDLFHAVRFKLFESQINGGIRETCEITVNGIPYRSLNESARINASIEIVDVLSAHYGARVPMFVDGAESVLDVRGTDSQQIIMTVDGTVDQLTFEMQGQKGA